MQLLRYFLVVINDNDVKLVDICTSSRCYCYNSDFVRYDSELGGSMGV